MTRRNIEADQDRASPELREFIGNAPQEMYDLFAEPELSAEELRRMAEAEQKSRRLQTRRRSE